MAHIDYFLNTLSPFTYLAGDGLEKLAEKHGATITYKPFDLLGVFARTGTPALPQRHESRLAYRAQDLLRLAKLNRLPLNLKPVHWPTNPAPSCYAIISAQNAGGGDIGGLCQSFLKACWANEQDISQDEVVRACLTASGFDPQLADSGLLSGAEIYGSNTEDAMTRGAFGAPFYIVGDQCFWGQDRLPHLDAHLAGEL